MNWRTVNRAAVAVGLACLLVVVLGVGGALGHGFSTWWVADSSIHTWVSTESDPVSRSFMEAIFDSRMTGQYGNRTVLSVQKLASYTTDVDAYWYVTSAMTYECDAVCMDENTAPNPDICNRTRIRFREGYVREATLDSRRQCACHEIGHSVGFDDSEPEVNIGCMSGGPNGVLSAHEIGHINAQWGGGP